jgi:very-short-patch-repair endonuclease
MRAQLSIARLAARQHGVVARRQLTDLGLDRGHIGRALAAGHLLRMHRGVYAVGHRAVADHGRWMAATLASEGVLSHRSAAALWGLPLNDNGLTRVTTPTDRRHARIDAHRADLHPRDRTVRHGIPVTTVARTLADLAHSLDDESLHRVVREAQFRDRFDDDSVKDALSRRPARRLTAYLDDPTVTQTDLEDRFLRICRRYRIPTPLTQHGARPRVDFCWPDRSLVVEVDGWHAHRTRVAFQDDRTNTNLLQLAGNVVLRYTWDDVRVRHAEVAAQVLSAGNFSSTHSGPSSARRYGRPPTRT